MTKFLLPAALLLLSATSMNAQDLFNFTDLFQASCDGHVIANGETLEITDFQDTSALFGEGAVTYSADIRVDNIDIMPGYLYGALLFGSQPSAVEYQANPQFWGDPQLCYQIERNGEKPMGNCLEQHLPFNAGSGQFEVPVEGVGSFTWNLHIVAAQFNADEHYTLVMHALTDDSAAAQPISEDFRINLHFHNPESGVNAIDSEADGCPEEYFDLQGRKVLYPQKGICIMRKGSDVRKVVIR